MKNIHILFVAFLCVVAAGCVSSAKDDCSGEYRNLFKPAITRDMFRAKLGTPIPSCDGSTNLYGHTNAYTFDVFAVRGRSNHLRALIVYYDKTLHYEFHELFDEQGNQEDVSGH